MIPSITASARVRAITGTPFPGQILKATPGASYQWAKDAVPIPGATSRFFPIHVDDIGSVIDCLIDGAGAPGVSVWSPNADSPRQWFDAAAALTSIGPDILASNNDPVMRLPDKSSHGSHLTQGVGNQQPLYISTVLHGRPALRFNGLNTVLPNTVGNFLQSEVFVVYANRTGTQGTFIGRVGGITGILVENYNVWPNGGVSNFVMSQPLNSHNLFSWRFDYSAGQFAAYLHNNLVGSLSAARVMPNLDTDLSLGGATYGRYFSGDICEVLIFNRLLTAPERARINAYLKLKFAI